MMPRRPWLPLLALAWLVTAAGCASQPPVSVSKMGGYPFLGRYEPVALARLDELPPRVREALEAHLDERLGPEFRARLAFAGGRAINQRDLLAAEPGASRYRWEVPGFILHFEFAVPEAGLHRYVAEVSLAEDGRLVRDIDLPSLRAAPGKLRLVPLRDVLRRVSKAEGVPVSDLSAEIMYDAGSDALVWRLSRTISREAHAAQIVRIDVLAHTGAILRKTPSTVDF